MEDASLIKAVTLWSPVLLSKKKCGIRKKMYTHPFCCSIPVMLHTILARSRPRSKWSCDVSSWVLSLHRTVHNGHSLEHSEEERATTAGFGSHPLAKRRNQLSLKQQVQNPTILAMLHTSVGYCPVLAEYVAQQYISKRPIVKNISGHTSLLYILLELTWLFVA